MDNAAEEYSEPRCWHDRRRPIDIAGRQAHEREFDAAWSSPPYLREEIRRTGAKLFERASRPFETQAAETTELEHQFLQLLCRGNVEGINEFLQEQHLTAEKQRRATSESATAGSNCRVDGRQVVNVRCYFSGLTMLQFAVLSGNVAMVQCLVKWGADVSTTNEITYRLHCAFGEGGMSPLFLACVLYHTAIVEFLLSCNPPKESFKLVGDLGDQCRHFSIVEACMGNAETVQALLSSTTISPSMTDVVIALGATPIATEEIFLHRFRWESQCCCSLVVLKYLFLFPVCRRLLDTPCYSNDEAVCKSFFCHYLLLRLCVHMPWPIGEIVEASSLVRPLAMNSASPLGKSREENKRLCERWCDVMRLNNDLYGFSGSCKCPRIGIDNAQRNSTVKPNLLSHSCCKEWKEKGRVTLPDSDLWFISPTALILLAPDLPLPVLRLHFCQSLDDEVLVALVENGGLPGVERAADIPFKDGKLHDGPTCDCGVELSAAQRRVSIGSILELPKQPFNQPFNLAEICRERVLCSIPTSSKQTSVSRLPIPEALQQYILFGAVC